jgi:FixJ family two-component response regulator
VSDAGFLRARPTVPERDIRVCPEAISLRSTFHADTRLLALSMRKTQPLIAVVDDDEPVCQALNRLLRSAGLNVETFASGFEFLKSLRDHTPDCVVLDLQMPQVDGFQVQSQLAEKGVTVPVVVITGWDAPHAYERAREEGAIAYLRKPVDDQALLDAIAIAITYEP